MGRLGNGLFQIAAALGANPTASFPKWKYQEYFEPQLLPMVQAGPVYKELRYEYDPLPASGDLQGYFQSYKYFGSTIPRFKESFRVQQLAKLPAGERIAIHIRRGDYVNHEAYAQLQITYFIQALLTIPDWKNKNIILFSDDMGYCKTHFECLPNAHFINGSEVEHLAMMSLCDYHILSNSSFSWWGAYLSEQKHVIYPKEYFRGSYADKTTVDLWPPNWYEFFMDDYRLDCSDMTFTIPVMMDSQNRKQNLDLSLCHIQKYTKAPVIVGECKTSEFGYVSQWAEYIKYPYTEFHRTKMLNEMALKATTPYIANWDCDIFVPPLQIWLTCEALRNGGQMVYPYDGRFARMDRVPWFKKIEQVVDIGVTSDAKLSRRDIKESVGGAVCWNKQAFIEYGMENEYMVSYAPEDVERYERAVKLKCKIEKIPGALYHMDHYKGPDSHNGNPHFLKSRALLESYRKMTADELRKEVDTWSWRHPYTPDYYKRISEGAARSARETMETLMKHWAINGFGPHNNLSIIDIGCGVGAWALGNPNYIGVDYGIPKEALLIPQENYRDWDLSKMDEIYAPLKKYDLCLCLEVAEHLPEKVSNWLIAFLCSQSDLVLFSAAIPGQGGTGHINEQWQTWWAEKFKANGFGPTWPYPVEDNPNVEPWYRQNMILYRRGEEGTVYNFVLPEYYEQIIKHRDNQIAELSERCSSLQKIGNETHL